MKLVAPTLDAYTFGPVDKKLCSYAEMYVNTQFRLEDIDLMWQAIHADLVIDAQNALDEKKAQK